MHREHHSSARKGIERLLRVLFWTVLHAVNQIQNAVRKEVQTVVKACCILQSMIMDVPGYDRTIIFRKDLEEHDMSNLNLEELVAPVCRV